MYGGLTIGKDYGDQDTQRRSQQPEHPDQLQRRHRVRLALSDLRPASATGCRRTSSSPAQSAKPRACRNAPTCHHGDRAGLTQVTQASRQRRRGVRYPWQNLVDLRLDEVFRAGSGSDRADGRSVQRLQQQRGHSAETTSGHRWSGRRHRHGTAAAAGRAHHVLIREAL